MIEFSCNTMLGLYNEWQGAGSLLEISLQKPFMIPADMIRNIQIEGQTRQPGSYTVDDVYGLVGSCWNGTVSSAEESISLREQIENSIKENIPKAAAIIKSYRPEPDIEKE